MAVNRFALYSSVILILLSSMFSATSYADGPPVDDGSGIQAMGATSSSPATPDLFTEN